MAQPISLPRSCTLSCTPPTALSNSNEPDLETAPTLPRTPTKPRTASSDPSLVSPATERVKQIFKQALPSPEALAKAQNARASQQILAEKGSPTEASQVFVTWGTTCYVTQERLFVTEEKAGKGSASEAWFANEIKPLTADEPRRIVLKRSASSQLQRENALAQTITLSSPSKRKKLNFTEAVFHLPEEKACIGIYEACQSDLNGLTYSPNTPASQVLPILRDIADGLCEITRQGIAHCDIKGANLLVTQEDGGSIGDFGLARRKSTQRHSTSLTPQYAAPFIWENILDQKYRRNGYQGQSADVFAFGVTLQLDVFARMLPQLANHYQIDITNKMNAIKPLDRAVDPKWNDQILLKIENKYRQNFQRIIYRPEKLVCFKPIQYVLTQILETIDLFQGHINSQEMDKMKGLAQLMHDLQDEDPKNLSAAMAMKRLDSLINLPEKTEEEETSTTAVHASAIPSESSSV